MIDSEDNEHDLKIWEHQNNYVGISQLFIDKKNSHHLVKVLDIFRSKDMLINYITILELDGTKLSFKTRMKGWEDVKNGQFLLLKSVIFERRTLVIVKAANSLQDIKEIKLSQCDGHDWIFTYISKIVFLHKDEKFLYILIDKELRKITKPTEEEVVIVDGVALKWNMSMYIRKPERGNKKFYVLGDTFNKAVNNERKLSIIDSGKLLSDQLCEKSFTEDIAYLSSRSLDITRIKISNINVVVRDFTGKFTMRVRQRFTQINSFGETNIYLRVTINENKDIIMKQPKGEQWLSVKMNDLILCQKNIYIGSDGKQLGEILFSSNYGKDDVKLIDSTKVALKARHGYYKTMKLKHLQHSIKMIDGKEFGLCIMNEQIIFLSMEIINQSTVQQTTKSVITLEHQ